MPTTRANFFTRNFIGNQVIVQVFRELEKKLGNFPKIPLGIIYKISNEDILRLQSPQREFFRSIPHANSMCAHQVITIQKLCYTWVILMTTHFLYPKIRVSALIIRVSVLITRVSALIIRVNALIFWNFSSQAKTRYLKQPFVKFLQQLMNYS